MGLFRMFKTLFVRLGETYEAVPHRREVHLYYRPLFNAVFCVPQHSTDRGFHAGGDFVIKMVKSQSAIEFGKALEQCLEKSRRIQDSEEEGLRSQLRSVLQVRSEKQMMKAWNLITVFEQSPDLVDVTRYHRTTKSNCWIGDEPLECGPGATALGDCVKRILDLHAPTILPSP